MDAPSEALRFRGDASNPNFPAVASLLRTYARHLGLGFESAGDGAADLYWNVEPPEGAGERLLMPARPHVLPVLDCAFTGGGYPVPHEGRRRPDRPPQLQLIDGTREFALYRQGDAWHCEWDILSFCADILYRRADALPRYRDAAREALCFSLPDKALRLHEAPWVDRWMFRLLGLIPRFRSAIKRAASETQLWLTHDIDNLAKWRLRSVAGQALRTPLQLARGRVGLLARNYGEILRRGLTGRDPYESLEPMFALEGRRSSTNFFLASGRDHLFHRYEIAKPRFLKTLRQAQKAVKRLGLHGQVHFISDAKGIRAERDKLEKLAGEPILMNRQHYLRWDPTSTYAHLAAAGFQIDSTMGYNDTPGFRGGTCRPYPWFDCETGRPVKLLVVPLIIAEFQFYDPQRFDGAAVRKTLREYMDIVRAQGGVYTVLFHNNYFHEAEFPGQRAVYRDLVAWADQLELPDFDPAESWRRYAGADD